jgi:hypothetical protein
MVVDPVAADDLDGIYTGHPWRVTSRSDPSFRFYADSDGAGTATFTTPRELPSAIPCRELLVVADNQEAAVEVQELMYGGILLATANPLDCPRAPGVYEVESIDVDLLRTHGLTETFVRYDLSAFGFLAATRAFGEVSLAYALEKYRLSLDLDWFTPHSASPRYGQAFRSHYLERCHQVDAGFAIVVAFAGIEELGLEARSSSKRPRFLDKVGTWNPVVLEDLHDRLKQAGVDVAAPITWVRRGSSRPLDSAVEPLQAANAQYADGEVVRDQMLLIEDAIHRVSYLRNFILAHRFSDMARFIGPYEVYNVQSLLRRLLLSKLGLWNAMGDASNQTVTRILQELGGNNGWTDA